MGNNIQVQGAPEAIFVTFRPYIARLRHTRLKTWKALQITDCRPAGQVANNLINLMSLFHFVLFIWRIFQPKPITNSNHINSGSET